MQNTARINELPLDKMCLISEVTKKLTKEEITKPSNEGVYIHGLFIEVSSVMIMNMFILKGSPLLVVKKNICSTHICLWTQLNDLWQCLTQTEQSSKSDCLE